MFSQLNLTGTLAVCTLSSVFRSFWHISGMESPDGEAHLALPVLSISQACPIVWTADSLCGVKAGYVKMMCDLPRCVQLSRESIHLLPLICLADLSVGRRLCTACLIC